MKKFEDNFNDIFEHFITFNATMKAKIVCLGQKGEA